MRGDGRVYWPYPTVCYIGYSHRGKEYRHPAARLGVDPKSLTPEKLEERRRKAEAAAWRVLRAKQRAIHRDEFVPPKEERVTAGELLDDYLLHLETKGAKSARTVRAQLAGVREAFGLTRAVDLTTARIEGYMKGRLDIGASRKTVNNEVSLLKAALNRARKAGRLIRVPYVGALKIDNARSGFFERAEFEAVAANLPDPIGDLARFGYLTGWRKGEIQPLRWEAVDRTAREIRLRTSKNGTGRVIPLEGELWDLIEKRWAAREYETTDGVTGLSDYVFHRRGRPMVNIGKSWKNACEAASLPGKLFHDFRRTAARDMIRAGTPETVAMRITGHKTRSMLDRYNITSTNDMRDAIRRTQEYRASRATNRNVVSFPSQVPAEESNE